MVGTVIGSLLWYTFGYGIVFGKSYYGIYGNPFDYFMLEGIPIDDCIKGQTIPALMYVTF